MIRKKAPLYKRGMGSAFGRHRLGRLVGIPRHEDLFVLVVVERPAIIEVQTDPAGFVLDDFDDLLGAHGTLGQDRISNANFFGGDQIHLSPRGTNSADGRSRSDPVWV